eukprot:5500857-Prymnesium_polylepis.1
MAGTTAAGDPDGALLCAWRAARLDRDWHRADALRASLRLEGVNVDSRTPSDQLRYDEKWAERMRALCFISTEGFLASSLGWAISPKLQRCRHPDDALDDECHGRRVSALRLGRALRSELTATSARIVCVEKQFLTGLIDAFTEEQERAPPPPFVLLAVNGGDRPLSHEMQAKIACLSGLRACYSNNLQAPISAAQKELFHPLPLGLPGASAPQFFEAALMRVREAALPWLARDRRLLVAPMRLSCRMRAAYIDVLSCPEYAHLVKIVHARLSLEEFLQLMSNHQSTLSPPGRGFDCFRTWQALAVGTVPLVVMDSGFDHRLLEDTGPAYISPPESLSVEHLEQLIDGLRDPVAHAPQLEMAHWRR